MRLCSSTLLVVGILILTGPAEAHHSQAAGFYMDQFIEIEGVIQSFLFRNPHPVLYVEVTGEDGEKIVWQIEFPPATVLAKRGWTAESFVPGEVIAARGHPSRVPGTYGIARAMITRPDGSPIR